MMMVIAGWAGVHKHQVQQRASWWGRSYEDAALGSNFRPSFKRVSGIRRSFFIFSLMNELNDQIYHLVGVSSSQSKMTDS